jgi:hypothetical protein
MIIGRVRFEAKPSSENQEFEEWEVADIVVFVKADTKEEALNSAKKRLKKEQWQLLKVGKIDKLIRERVLADDAEVIAAYLEAEEKGTSFRVFSRHVTFGGSTDERLLPERVSEELLDRVIERIGGSRLQEEKEGRTADYLVDGWIFELKDLQREGLHQEGRQKKLISLFSSYWGNEEVKTIDPEILNSNDRRRFEEILSSPIQGQVKSASKQIRETKDRMGDPRLKGGLIYINTGYWSLPNERFGPMVQRYVDKDTTQIDAVLCVSTWINTNGFESFVFYRVYPEKIEEPVLVKIKDAFDEVFTEAMTALIKGTIESGTERATPITPVAFSTDDAEYSWIPDQLPRPWSDPEEDE